jgi:hypothetical protein
MLVRKQIQFQYLFATFEIDTPRLRNSYVPEGSAKSNFTQVGTDYIYVQV